VCDGAGDYGVGGAQLLSMFDMGDLNDVHLT
jgi:hypothetical protein